MKKYWVIAGAVLLIVGFVVFLFPYVETVEEVSANTTVEPDGSYYFESFSAGRQDWADLDISTSADVLLIVRGQIVDKIFSVAGRLFQYRLSFDDFDAYRVEIYNRYGNPPSSVDITGSIYVRRIPEYLYPFKLVGLVQVNGIGVPVILLGLGITVIGLLKKPSVEGK